ncbi:surface glycoprotein [Halolamina salifodinae]|uniref:Surface glycoprotein (TIGR04207 family) n=1 Tax=Halolamina salifodinae TaxID=1202767 RepID=A0A8T4GYR4_9EURY|nr:surface glycoprotein [Halolamina salifodinae]MBP1988141.1 surface glycoprotein (TIGR04207 family) [Halolamina salifodinae]
MINEIMTHSKTREKARAVFLAALMVVSVFGGTMALAGTAAAAASGLSVDSGAPAQPGDTITVSTDVSTAGNDATFLVVDSGDSPVGSKTTVTDGGTNDVDGEENGVVTAELSLGGAAEGEASVYASEGSDTTSASAEAITSFVIDNSEPSLGATVSNIAGGTVNTTTPTLEINLTENGQAGINSDTVEVSVDQSDKEKTYKLNVSEAPTGVTYDESTDNLTVDFSSENIPDLVDGSMTWTVTAADNAGNSFTSGEQTFTVDVGGPTLSLNSPTADSEVGDNQQKISIIATEANLNTDSIEVTVTNDSATLYTESSDAYSVNAAYGDSDETEIVIDPSQASSQTTLPDGPIYVEVSAADANGNSASANYEFSVDTTEIGVESVELAGYSGTYNTSDSATVRVTFNDSVDASQVKADVFLKGTASDIGLASFTSPTGEPNVAEATLAIGTGFENDSAMVEVVAAQDDVTNGLASNANTTFGVDTTDPSVTSHVGGSFTKDLSGVVDFRNAVTVTGDDVVSRTYELTSNGETVATLTPSEAASFDTRTVADGASYKLVVVAEDNASNTDRVSSSLTINNVEGTITAKGDTLLTGDADLTTGLSADTPAGVQAADLFDYSGLASDESVTVSYAVYNGTSGTFGEYTELADHTLNTSTLEDGLIKAKLTITKDDGSSVMATQTAEVDNVPSVTYQSGADPASDSVHLENANADGEMQVVIVSDEALSTLDVGVTNVHYAEDSTTNVTIDDFTATTKSNGDVRYTTTVEADYDGQYKLTVHDAVDADNEAAAGVEGGTDMTTVDTEDSHLVDADIVGGSEGQIDVRLTFSEPISAATFDKQFNGAGVSVADASATDGDGIVNVTVSDEVQTGGDAMLNATTVTEQFGDSSSTATTGADVTFELSYTEDLNVVSIPAETGSVALDDVEFGDEVDSVMTYDDGWMSYNVQTGDGDLQEMVGGVGYIVKANSSGSVDVEVENVPSDEEAVAINSESLNNGWNLVGAFQEGDQSVDQAMSTLPSSADWGVEKGYTGQNVQVLEPGEGYWLFTNDDSGMLAPVDYTGLQSGQPTIVSTNAYENGDATDELVVDGNTVKVKVDATDDSGVSKVYADGSALGGPSEVPLKKNAAGVYVGTFTIDAATATADEGQTDVDVTVIDASGNVEYGSDTVNYDATPLNTDISVSKNSSDNVVLTVTSNEKLSTLKVTGSNNLGGTYDTIGAAEGEFTESGSGPYTYTLVTSTTTTGGNTYTATIDNAVDTNNAEDSVSSVSDSLKVESVGSTSTFSNPMVDPAAVQPSTSTDSQVIKFDVSPNTEWDDGNTDTVYINLPDKVVNSQTSQNSRVGTVDVVDGDNVDYSSNLVLGDDGDNVYDTVELSFSAQKESVRVEVSSLTLDYPSAIGDYTVGAKIVPSKGASVQDDKIATLTVDDNAPTSTGVDQQDSDGDGNIDTAVLTFSESIDDSTVEPGDYTIGGTTATTKATGTTADDNTIEVSIDTSSDATADDGIGSAPVDVVYASGSSGATADIAGNELADVTIKSGDAIVSDSAAPVIQSVTINTGSDSVDVTFSESVNNVDATDFNVSVGGTDRTIGTVNSADPTYTITMDTYTINSDEEVIVSIDSNNNDINDGNGNSLPNDVQISGTAP